MSIIRMVSILLTGLSVVLSFACGSTGLAEAQSAPSTQARVEAQCTDADFLAGKWDVRDSKGTLDAVLTETLADGHCASTEIWDFTPVYGSKHIDCLLVYSSATLDWNKLCTGFNNGDRYLSLGGKLQGKDFRFRFVSNKTTKNDISQMILTPLLDGRVRERVRHSPDAGRTWIVDDEAYYSRHV